MTLNLFDQSIDTKDAAGKAFLGMLTVFAEFETNVHKARQIDGFANATAKATQLIRKPALEKEMVATIKAMGGKRIQCRR